MPITKSAKKAHRSSLKKRVFNIRRKNKADIAVKTLKKFISAGDKKGALNAMSNAQKALDKASKSNTLKKGTANRKKSKLAKMLKKLS